MKSKFITLALALTLAVMVGMIWSCGENPKTSLGPTEHSVAAKVVAGGVTITSPTSASPATVPPAGGTVAISYTITVDGNGTVYASASIQTNPAKTVDITQQSSAAGTLTLTTSVEVPSGTTPGTYDVRVRARQPNNGSWTEATNAGAVIVQAPPPAKVAPQGTINSLSVSPNPVDQGGTLTVNIGFAGVSDSPNGVHVTVTGPGGPGTNTASGQVSQPAIPLVSVAVSISIPAAANIGAWNVSEVTIQGFDGNAYHPTQLVFTSPTGGGFNVQAPPVIPPADTTPPVVTGSVTSGAPGNNGWYTSDVVVTWSAEDPESGIASGPTPATQTITTEGAGQIFTATAVNGAGLTGTGMITVSIDKTPPSISGAPDRAPNENGWYKADVTVSFTAADAIPGSGIASVSDPTTLSEGKNQSVTGTAADSAGNSASFTVSGINIDKTPPVITSGTPTGTSGLNDWWTSNVIVPFSATDNLSGFAPDGTLSIDLASKATSGEGSSLRVTSDGISDLAGNPAVVIQAGPFKVDWTPPVVNITMPSGGPSYLLNAPLSATWSATDNGGSGVVPPSNGTIPLATSSVGSKTITAPVVQDQAGNSSNVASESYSVIYGFRGLLSPYDPTKVSKAGSTVPLKWQYTDYSGIVVPSASASPSVTANGATIASPGKSGMQYDSLTYTWQVNWQTKGLPASSYAIVVTSGQTGQSNGGFTVQLR